jgi:serine/threonine-protein kinase
MTSPEHPSTADRNLLFGILAIQVNFIDRDELIAAINIWVLEKHKPLGQILLERRKLTADQVGAINTLIEQHLKMHGDDPELSLRATVALPFDLDVVQDADMQASIAKLSPVRDIDETLSPHQSRSEDARYRKLRHHADGGQGRVFVADDVELHREVALKENKPEYSGNSISRLRLVLEAEITGGLEHPGIVPIYGLGTYADGRPYYAMRLIRGDSLDTAIKQFHAAEKPGRDAGERSLAFRQLLRRFVDVCNAVAYAHSRGVLHRDLKPKNVMLGRFGETLVVDWGLAKAGAKEQTSGNVAPGSEEEHTLRPASGSSIEATEDGNELGTPPYMSPEQAQTRISELTAASDIYSLGSTLYALLAGRPPYEAPTRKELMEKVCSGQFTPPKQVKPEIPAALDAICRKAMSLEPKDRYANALDFAADIEHWLADEPVGVFPEPWSMRAGRWARRHRAAVAIAVVFLICAVIGLAVSTALITAEQHRTAEQKHLAENNYRLATRQKFVAETNFRLARDQIFKLVDLMESSEVEFTATSKLQTTRKEILDSAANACSEFLKRQPGDRELALRSAQVFRYAANVHRFIGEVEAAENQYRESIRLYSQAVAQRPKDSRLQLTLSETLRDYAKLQSNTGKLKEATATLGRSIEMAEKLLPEGRRALAAALLNRSNVEYICGQFDKSITDAERSETEYEKLLSEPGAKAAYDRLLIAYALNVQAADSREKGDLDKALRSHAKAIEQMAAASKQGGISNADVRHSTAALRLEQCRTYSKNAKQHEFAEKNLLIAISEWETLSKTLPKVPLYRESLGEAYLLLAGLRIASGEKLDEAKLDLEKARDLFAKLVEVSPKTSGVHGDLGRTYLLLGHLAERQKSPADENYAKAVAELTRASELAPEDFSIRRDLDEANSAMKH